MRVVIAGGGFGGVRAALKLANRPGFEVKLISKQRYFEYHAALYRSATGRSPLEVAIPLADFFKSARNVEVVEGEAASINPTDRILATKDGTEYPYDAVLLALGAVTQYFGIKGLAEYSEGVKTIQEALELKRHLHEDLVSQAKAERNYVVIGGGATGVELAAELKPYLEKIRRNHGIVDTRFNVDLVEASSQLLPNMPVRYSQKVQKRLTRLGVKIYLDTTVKSETVKSIQLPHGSINSHVVIWTAGVANNPLFATMPELFKRGKGGRVEVDQFLQAAPGIYVIGDSANTKFSGMAQTALHDADFVTDNLRRELSGHSKHSYTAKPPIYAVPVGPHWSAVLWGKTEIYGRLGWALRRLADLRLYLKFLPPSKALTTWRYGMLTEEVCPICD